MAEGHWKHLQTILSKTDSCNQLPSNRPLHAYLHYQNRLQAIEKYLWKNPDLAGWGRWLHSWERDEFQNRGAIHTHGIAWLSLNIPSLIAKNIIRADVPDPEQEPELYDLVMKHQIHTCNPQKCGGPLPNGMQCRKHFPQPLSYNTCPDLNSTRYIYKRTKEADRWVVPYHAPTLLLWEAHCNFQYVTTRGFAKYLTKYVTKAEPTELFKIHDHGELRAHILARRVGAMEIMALLLGKPICRSTAHVQFLPTLPQNLRTRSIMPVHLITDPNMNPYWDDAIDKYFARPADNLFDNLTYPNYHANYMIQKKLPNARTIYWRDMKNRIVTKRKTPLLLRYPPFTIEHGDVFFFQQLLLKKNFRQEQDMRGQYETYREHFAALYPAQYLLAINRMHQSAQVRICNFNTNYHNFLNTLISTTTQELQSIIRIQLDSLQKPRLPLHREMILAADKDQYNCITILSNIWGNYNNKNNCHPFFFVTGSAGTGKSYIIQLVTNYLQQQKREFLLMAPTGVAAQNIGGKTIHSALRIKSTNGSFTNLICTHQEDIQNLLKISAIIIDEISMVSAELLQYISSIFSQIKSNSIPFGGVPVLLLGDLAQLPPINGTPVFKAAIWKEFFPIFLTTPHRQGQDIQFYQLLQELRVGQLSEFSRTLIQQKVNASKTVVTAIDTTHVVGYKHLAYNINSSICNALPRNDTHPTPIHSCADDYMNERQLEKGDYNSLYCHHTNLPIELTLCIGARVMFLNNTFFNSGLANGTIGVVTGMNYADNTVEVTFPTSTGLTVTSIRRVTDSFLINGAPCSRTQFPLQNAFALTVHKTQGLTLPHISLSIDDSMFACGQVYVAFSRATSWENLDLYAFEENQIHIDQEVIIENQRLWSLFTQRFPQQ